MGTSNPYKTREIFPNSLWLDLTQTPLNPKTLKPLKPQSGPRPRTEGVPPPHTLKVCVRDACGFVRERDLLVSSTHAVTDITSVTFLDLWPTHRVPFLRFLQIGKTPGNTYTTNSMTHSYLFNEVTFPHSSVTILRQPPVVPYGLS
jgi:hypothetical protein